MENLMMIAIAKNRFNDDKIILSGKNITEIAQLAVFNKSVVQEAWHIRATELLGAMKQLEEAGIARSDKFIKKSINLSRE